MVSKTHTINLGRSKNKISIIVGTDFAPKQNKINLLAFLWYQLKPVEIVFGETTDKIKDLNWNYVSP